jgi:CheY-like chemotaxis protein
MWQADWLPELNIRPSPAPKQIFFLSPEIGACRILQNHDTFTTRLDKFGQSRAHMNAPRSEVPARAATVYVVDDEPLLLELAVIILKPIGCHVQTFRDPETALKQFANALPDLVITDYAMGRMNGMDLIRECRRLKPCQKTLLVSGTVDEQVFAGAVIKPDRFLTKPYQFRDFLNCVRDLLAAA